MLAIWNDGYIKTYKFGKTLCGVRHNGVRPKWIVILAHEIRRDLNVPINDYVVKLQGQVCDGGNVQIVEGF